MRTSLTKGRLAVFAALPAAALLVGLTAGPAFAAPPPGSGQVTGTVTVPETLTLSLSANCQAGGSGQFCYTPQTGETVSASAFTLTTPAGVDTQTGNIILAEISTNDGAGYSLTDYLDSTNASGFPGATSGSIPAADISSYGVTSGTWSPLTSPVTVATASTVSGSASSSNGAYNSGGSDYYILNWGFTVPANQVGQNYSGLIDVLATGN
jgi:hypothetical protein